MSNNSPLQGFMKKLATDEKLKNEFEKIAKEKSIDEVYEFALKHSDGDFSKEEFRDCLFALLKTAENEPLKESSLDQISGGGEGALTDVKEFWEATKDADQAQLIAKIYKNEETMLDEKNKYGYIKKALATSSSINDLIKTIGELWLSHKDRQFEALEREDKADERRISDLKNQIKLKKLEEMLDQKGIKH